MFNRKLRFVIYYLTHATNGREYYCDSILDINGDYTYTEDSIDSEDIDKTVKKMSFHVEGHGKLDGTYVIYIDGVPLDKVYKIDKNGKEYLIDPANYYADFYNYSKIISIDDPVWELLGYEEEQSDDE